MSELSPIPINAKLDTGAQTSAIHAFRLRRFTRDGERWARFEIHPYQRNRRDSSLVEARIIDKRVVKSSNGEREERPVIRTLCEMGGVRWRIELTLTSRDDMSFRLLLGRAALRDRFVVDPSNSYLLSGE